MSTKFINEQEIELSYFRSYCQIFTIQKLGLKFLERHVLLEGFSEIWNTYVTQNIYVYVHIYVKYAAPARRVIHSMSAKIAAVAELNEMINKYTKLLQIVTL